MKTKEKTPVMLLNLRQIAIVLAVTVTIVYSIAYTSLQYFSSSNYGGNVDTLVYIRMAKERELVSLRPQPYASRLLTLVMVKLLPDIPASFFSEGRQGRNTEEWQIKVKFALVNSLFLALTGMLFSYYLKVLNFSFDECLLGILLLFSCKNMIYNSTIPLVEGAGIFFILLVFFCLATDNIILMTVTFFVGIFAKETLILAIPVMLIAVKNRRLLWIGSTVPGIAGYALWKLLNGFPVFQHVEYVRTLGIPNIIDTYFRFNMLMDLISSFGLLWVPAIYALWRDQLSAVLKRQYTWICLLFIVALVFSTGFGRTLFLAFPVIIPGALLGIRSLRLGSPVQVSS